MAPAFVAAHLPHEIRPRSGSSAKAQLLTILGELVLPHGGSMWTSTVVETLGVLDVGEANARQAVARLSDQGIVESERSGRRVRWHLTDHGFRLLTTGTERIYGFGHADDRWNGRWLVVLCSVPEDQRAKRQRLRAQLEFAGFGFLAAGVAVSPHLDREDVANDILTSLDLVPRGIVFHAETGPLVGEEDVLRRGWDLDSLAHRYDGFIGSFQRRAPGSDRARFVALVELVHAWRRFPFIDPEIPEQLLPRGWPLRRARELFDDRHARWSPTATAWYLAVESGSSSTTR